MDSNEETAKDPKDHTSQLSAILDIFKDKSVQEERDQVTAYTNDVQGSVGFPLLSGLKAADPNATVLPGATMLAG